MGMTTPEPDDGLCRNSTTWEDQPGYSGGTLSSKGTYRTWTCGLPRGHAAGIHPDVPQCRDGDHRWWPA